MFQIQVIPPGKYEPIACNLSAETIQTLTAYCSQQINCDVALFYDYQCTQSLTPYLSLQQCGIQNGSVIYAKITSPVPYCEVTCWLIVDGQELQDGIVIRSDYTFEEVLQNAITQGFIEFMPTSIEVTNQTGQKLTSLMEIQMFKLIPEGVPNAEFYLHFTSNGQPPQINANANNLFSFYPPQLQQPQIQSPPFKPPPFQPPPFQSPQFSPQVSYQYQIPQYSYQQANQSMKQISGYNQSKKQISQDLSIKEIQQALDQMIIMPFVTLVINPQGTQVVYKYHVPVLVSGYFTQNMGKRKARKPDYDWQTRNGIEFAEYNNKGFIIRWKNDTYNAMRLQLIT